MKTDKPDAYVHLRVDKALKAKWVAASRSRGMKLTDWLVERIEGKTMDVFKIPESLAEKYHGAGHALAAITGGEIIDFIYVRDVLTDHDDEDQDDLEAAINNPSLGPTVRKLQSLGEVSVGMCSCWEFTVL